MVIYDGTMENGTKYIVRLYNTNAKYQFVVDEIDMLAPHYKDALSGEGVSSYTIGSRSLTKNQMSASELISKYEALIAKKISMENGGSARKAVGIVPRDW